MFIGRTLAGPQVRGALRRKGAQGTLPHPCESRPRVSHADGGNGGRVAWRAGGCFIPQGPSTSSSQSRDGVVELRSGFVGVRVLVGWWGGVASRHCLAGRPGACAFVGYLRSDPRSYLAHALASERLCACGVEPSVVLSVRALVCSVSRVGRHIKHLNGHGAGAAHARQRRRRGAPP